MGARRVSDPDWGPTRPDASRAAAAVQQASGQITRTGITFVVACTYFGIVASATSHADLLIGRTLAIPLLNADVPVLAFFAVAPLIVLLLHLNLLLVQRIYRRSLRNAQVMDALDSHPLRLTALGTSLAPRALASGEESERFVQFLLFILFVVVNVFLPLSVLLVLQLQILPRHNHWMVIWHRVATCADGFAILYFVPLIISGRGWWAWTRLVFQPGKDTSKGRLKERVAIRGLRRFAVRLVILLVPMTAILSSTCIIHDPSEVSCSQDSVRLDWDSWPDWFSYHLDVTRGSLSIPSGLRIVGRDLRCADLEGLDLHGIDFRRTELAGARFDGSNLSMARFDDARTNGTESERIPPSFRSADLRGASFQDAHLAGADLHEAEASGATFARADLRMADLSKAVLLGSELDRAHFEGAKLDEARLTCSTADGAQLDLSSLVAAHLEAVRLTGDSSAVGADLREATLWEAKGLMLEYQNLENAALWGVCPGPWRRSATFMPMRPDAVIQSSSLREASFRRYSVREWRANVTDRVERMVEVLGQSDRADDLRVERIVTRLPSICRATAFLEGNEPAVPSQWSDDVKRADCLPPPTPAPRSENLLRAEEATELNQKFGWSVSASPPGMIAKLDQRWVDRLVRCGDPTWMKVLLGRVFSNKYTGLDELDETLWEYFETRKRSDCAALDTVIEEVCAEDASGWNRAIDRFPGAADSALRCPA